MAAGVAQRWRRARFRGSLSAPYLSGDLFRTYCDVALDDTGEDARRRFTLQYRQARTIFVKTDLLGQCLDEFAPKAVACRVLITGNSDREIHEMPSGLPPNLGRWFAQNTFVTNQVLRPLPIGLENHALGRNGRVRDLQPCTDADIAAKKLRLFAAFAPSAPERQGLLELLAQSTLVDVPGGRLAPARFHSILRRYRFVIAPRGNGVDTHRFWEALYMDALPITRRTPWSRAMAAEGVPLIEVDAWPDVLTWTAADLDRFSASWPARPSRNAWLWDTFWRARVAAELDRAPEPRTAVPAS